MLAESADGSLKKVESRQQEPVNADDIPTATLIEFADISRQAEELVRKSRQLDADSTEPKVTSLQSATPAIPARQTPAPTIPVRQTPAPTIPVRQTTAAQEFASRQAAPCEAPPTRKTNGTPLKRQQSTPCGEPRPPRPPLPSQESIQTHRQRWSVCEESPTIPSRSQRIPSEMSSSSESEFGGEFLGSRSVSSDSDGSWASWTEEDLLSPFAAECREFMKSFVRSVFDASDLSQEEKARFGELCQHTEGRLWFARYINAQRGSGRCVEEQIFYRLMQFFAVVLFECHEADDFSPAKTLMTMCFTYYFQGITQPNGSACDQSECGDRKHFLYSYLREQPLWRCIRFWNAAFFDALQTERFRRPAPPAHTDETEEDTDANEMVYRQNVAFGQLGTFLCNMQSFGISKELCQEFLEKQATISTLTEEQVSMLKSNVDQAKYQ